MDFGSDSGSGGGFMQFLSGLFGDSGKPFADAERAYDKHSQPWINAGRGAINPFSQRLGEMGDSGKFAGDIMKDYQQSPFAKYQQQQGMNTANAFGSASGLSGSTPLMQAAQNNAQNISSQDMQKYFDNRMGINRDYMTGQNQLMNYGQGFDANAAPWMGQAAGGKAFGQNQDRMNMLQGYGSEVEKGISMLLKMLMGGAGGGGM